ncbi:MAG: hypothetical protein KF884_12270 [Fimbriimonadaceae bacterium]|nr:hypothetical protein [Fimbriimonadaceae bacterium]QYK58319.1 MAG: hypothetical protein KF884_12270 [Fimbriimonadaceae bacterium]
MARANGHHRPVTPRSPIDKLRFVAGYLRDFLKPAYHLRKIKEDVRASVHAVRNRDLEMMKGDHDGFARAIRGRLFATYFLVGPFGAMGFLAGLAFQYGIGKSLPYLGLLTFAVTIIVGNIGTIIGFQTLWGLFHRKLYSKGAPTFFDWVLFWRDILPLQWSGFRLWLAANVVLLPLATVLLGLLDQFLPAVTAAVPVAIIVPTLELFLVHSSLIRLMGDLFERESHRIADNHLVLSET